MTNLKESDILHQNGNFWVCREEFGSGIFRPKSIGYAVYEDGITHSKRVAQIGWEGNKGFHRAIAECDKRAAIAKIRKA